MEILNVAGTRGSKEPDVWKFAYETLETAFFSEQAHPCSVQVSGFQFQVFLHPLPVNPVLLSKIHPKSLTAEENEQF